MDHIIRINNLGKVYDSGLRALSNINLDIRRGEIFALLGPNGAGKTTLISTICGITTASEGSVLVDGFDIRKHYKQARDRIGLVPQELATSMFETVWANMVFSRGLFGKAFDTALAEKILKQLSLWEKRHDKVMALSGGMKRRVLIAKALVHEPKILFLDEPTAGVDVELRHDMWEMVRALRKSGVTIILTTHYIEEAEDMADRIGIINGGEISMVEDKTVLMKKLGSKQLTVSLQQPLTEIPASLESRTVSLSGDGVSLIYNFDVHEEHTGISEVLRELDRHGIEYKDLHTSESSLEDIFVSLVRSRS